MPVGVILKYLELIEEEGYGYVLYDYGKDSKELVEKYKFERLYLQQYKYI